MEWSIATPAMCCGFGIGAAMRPLFWHLGLLSWTIPTRTGVARWHHHQWPGCLVRPLRGKPRLTSVVFCLCVLVVRHIGNTSSWTLSTKSLIFADPNRYISFRELQIILRVVSVSFAWQHSVTRYPKASCAHTCFSRRPRGNRLCQILIYRIHDKLPPDVGSKGW